MTGEEATTERDTRADHPQQNGSGSGHAAGVLPPPPDLADDQHLLGSDSADDRHLLTGPGDSTAGPDEPAPPKPGNIKLIALIVVLAFIVLALLGIVPRYLRQPELNSAAKSQQSAGTNVQFVNPQKPPKFESLVLPGNIQAVQQSAINARASGYVERLLVDIGDHVTAGQTLAILSTPDVDQEVAQARAQLVGSQASLAQSRSGLVAQRGDLSQAQANLSRSIASLAQASQQVSQAVAQLAQARQAAAQQKANLAQAQASLNLAQVTNTRYQNLVKQGAIDQETADQQYANYQTSLANFQALQAALGASQSNIDAFSAAVRSSQANVTAYQQGVSASRAAVDTARAQVGSSQAVVAASQADVSSNVANLQRLAVLQNYKDVTAPFTGVITARNVDNGDLVGSSGNSGGATSVGSGSAGTSTAASAASGTGSSGSASSGGSSSSLFSEAQLSNMHIYINVPQSAASQIYAGLPVQVTSTAVPGHTFIGTVARTAGALDPSSRTLVTEVRIPNPKGQLHPGMFAEVSFQIPTGSAGFLVPDTTIVTNTNDTQVIEVTPQSTLHFQSVKIGRDFGKIAQIISGLKGNEQLVLTPMDGMREGEKVSATAAPPDQSATGVAPSQPGPSNGGQSSGQSPANGFSSQNSGAQASGGKA